MSAQIPITEVLVYIGGTLRSRHEVQPGDYIIGRDPGCDIPVNANLVSWEHARLRVNYQEWFIEDLDGCDCTLVDDKPLTSRTQQVWPSQKIQIGRATIELHALARVALEGSLPPPLAVIRQFLPPEILRDRRYKIGRVVNEDGGMGLILEAIDQPTARTVAMKVMRKQDDGGDVIRFIEEAKVTAQLEHPNIPPVHELSVDEQKRVFYTMKFVRGVTLRDILRSIAAGDRATVAKYPLGALLTVFQKVCDAMAFAHSRGVIHRDLKPQNIMLGDYGEVLVMDWGLAKFIGAPEQGGAATQPMLLMDDGVADGATLPGTILGTVQYMAPEQARGEVRDLDARADIYALGATLYFMLALRPSVTGRLPAEIADRVGRGEIDELVRRGDQLLPHLPDRRIPESLAAVVRKAMALEREDRYQSVAELQAEVAAYQSGFATAAENASAWKQLQLLVRRHRLVTTVGTGSLLTIAVLSGIYLVNVIAARDHARTEFRRAERETGRAKEALAIADRVIEEKSVLVTDLHKANAEKSAALAKETAERIEKDRAFVRLRGTAPYLFALAEETRAKINNGEALTLIESAVDLEPENPRYHLVQGHLLQATEQLGEAAATYRKVLELPSDPATQKSARDNLDLCDELLRDTKAGAPLTAAQLGKLCAAMLNEGRVHDAVEIEKKLQAPRRLARLEIQKRLSTLPLHKTIDQTPFGPWDARLREFRNGTFVLDLSKLTLTEVPSLAGLPITELILDGSSVVSLQSLRDSALEKLSANTTAVRDLTPLAGLPLRDLNVRGTQVTSLAPLSKLPLQRLVISGTAITDLAPLAGLPLEEFVADSSDLRDIGVLATLPLKRVSLRNCLALTDLTPLFSCKKLEALVLAKQQNVDLLGLRSLPNLGQISDQDRFLDHAGGVRFDLIPPAGLYWEARNLTKSENDRLRRALDRLIPGGLRPAKPLMLTPTDEKDGRFELNVQECPEVDLNALRGLPIAKLQAFGVVIADFSPLAETPIVELEIGGRWPTRPVLQDFRALRQLTTLRHLSVIDSPFADLRMLDGLRLESLNIAATAVTDLSPLLKMPLERLDFTKTAVTNIAPILKIPTLKEVGVPEEVWDAVPRTKRNEWLLWGSKDKTPAKKKRSKSR